MKSPSSPRRPGPNPSTSIPDQALPKTLLELWNIPPDMLELARKVQTALDAKKISVPTLCRYITTAVRILRRDTEPAYRNHPVLILLLESLCEVVGYSRRVQEYAAAYDGCRAMSRELLRLQNEEEFAE